MRAVWLTLLLAAVVAPNLTTGAPLTKWFKTDNNTYYIEPDQKFSWQQSYAECKSKNLNLVTLKHFNGDELLNEYLKQTFADPVPEFWLRSNLDLDLNNILPSLTEDFFKIKMEDAEITDVLAADNPDNCVLTKDGSSKACEILHGFICKAHNNGNGAQNIQNIILKFS
ncbi:uncharacterized protein LOC106091440 isoform X1 [Stomoxys calcitrans]|uniref:uncharacterized protein LOC106091440 isoform X1 n=1 Tax=Stomoxys calcitrans TaxID=35570 RepID=UPI0027E32669|nr:uncharacterized protein LOC106091440 isoform X1 [Stomoxys calcitrans]